MHALIVFGTNSTGTYEAATIIADVLQTRGWNTEVISAEHTTTESLRDADVLVLGSCSWERRENGKRLEGQLQQHFYDLVERLQGVTLPKKPIAIFGLGDARYEVFCGAVDHLEAFANALGADVIGTSLRVDRFPYFLQENRNRIRTWAMQIGDRIADRVR